MLGEPSTWERGLGVNKGRLARALTAQTLAELAARSSNPICIFEDSVSKLGDGWLARATLAKPYKDEIYHVAASNSATDIDKAMSQAESAWLLIGALAQTREAIAPRNMELDEAMIGALPRSTIAIAVSAFDGEGYVLWSAAR
jgi:hypothetical protein